MSIPTDIKPCPTCPGMHYQDHARFCCGRGDVRKPIKPTKKEVRMLAQRNVQTTIVHTR